ncbi:histidine phosphatase family protein [Aliiroseovarius lamellibrachiae]|uniref:histidine phosphatase family protein n=1 Tax=Aliiroseovarius lamellibrachiae TaxID=1924933 RepID=UPI001BE0716C|nr:histidine phosphatase family protein [Aliiroseovarius lamellibrachiae]MBT2131243.1 phosphoglycerate mutase family protein [Aliiroseovarius lamellibrachiae]
MPEVPEIYVIRHGQTEWNVAQRHQGKLDSPLTDKGREQARLMGGILQRQNLDLSKVKFFSSPLGRARKTADIALAGFNVALQGDDRLSEIDFGQWEGKTQSEIDLGWPELSKLAEEDPIVWNFQSPGGESLTDLEHRCDAFLAELSGPAVLFTHGILSRVIRARWLGLNPYEMLELPGGQGVIFHLSQALGHVTLEK